MSNQNTQNEIKEQFDKMDTMEFINSSPLELFDFVMAGLGLMPEKNPENLNTLLKIAFFSGMLTRQAVILEIGKLKVTEEESINLQIKAEDDLAGFCVPFLDYYTENPDVVYALLKGSKVAKKSANSGAITFHVSVTTTEKAANYTKIRAERKGMISVEEYLRKRLEDEFSNCTYEAEEEVSYTNRATKEQKVLETLSVAMKGISVALQKLAPVEVDLLETRSVGEVLFPGE